MAENLEISKEGYLKLIEKVLQNKTEEREMALDRYRKADNQMETVEQFILMGKTAVSFLELASTTTNDLAMLAKEIKSIIYKDNAPADSSSGIDEKYREAVVNELEKTEKGKKQDIVENTEENK